MLKEKERKAFELGIGGFGIRLGNIFGLSWALKKKVKRMKEILFYLTLLFPVTCPNFYYHLQRQNADPV